jgi:hypothetical protein
MSLHVICSGECHALHIPSTLHPQDTRKDSLNIIQSAQHTTPYRRRIMATALLAAVQALLPADDAANIH